MVGEDVEDFKVAFVPVEILYRLDERLRLWRGFGEGRDSAKG